MIKIFTFAFNEPKFLEYQKRCFSRFLKNDFELICINNAVDYHGQRAIQSRSEALGIKSFIVENPDHSLHGISHQRALQWAWSEFICKHDDLVLIVDHDMFLIQELLINSDYPIIGVPQSRGHIKYLHPGFLILNIPQLPDKHLIDFYGGNIDGFNVDSGGQLYRYLKHTGIEPIYLPLTDIVYENSNLHILPDSARHDYDQRYCFQTVSDYMLHFRIGSNWIHLSKGAQERRKEQLFLTLDFYL